MVTKQRFFHFIKHTLYPYRYWLILQIFNVFFWAFLRKYCVELSRNLVNILKERDALDMGALEKNLFFVLMISVSWLVSFRIHDFIWRKVRPGLRQSLATRMTSCSMQHSQRFYQENLVGNTSSKIREVAHKLPASLELLTDSALFPFLTIAFVLFSTAKLGLVFFAILGGWIFFFLFSLWMVYPHLQKINRSIAESHNAISGHVVDVLGNLMSVRLFTRYCEERRLMAGKTKDAMQKERHLEWLLLCFFFVQGLLFVVVQGASLWVIMSWLKEGKAQPGDVIYVIEMGILAVVSLFPFLETLRKLLDNWAYIRQGISVILTPAEIQDKSNASDLVVSQGDIVYDNVTFAYEKEAPLFQDFSLTIGAKQQVALVGYSGSGKTTCLSLLLRLFDVEKGRILIDGQDLRDVSQDSLHRSISIVTQDPYLFQRSIMENIRYGNPKASDEEVMQAAKEAFAHDFISNLPQGYDTLVGERGASVSGGQKQRIAIARAFLKRAPILIMDEATSQLDPGTDLLIQEGLKRLRECQKQTTLIISHRMSTLKHVDRILLFSKGRIVESGTHEELLAANKQYKQLWSSFE
jgi:ATP-binding cassette subfamily B protein